MLLAVAVVWTALSVSVARASWRSSTPAKVPALQHAEPEQASGMQDLLEAMAARSLQLDRDELSALSPSNPSCFRTALQALPTSSPCSRLAHSDSMRTKVAASMAVCEIKTAGQRSSQVPKECTDWQTTDGDADPTFCIEALSRSPQHWNSYSGYLREVVTLCSAFRRWADIETARDLQATTAQTLADVLASLRRFEDLKAKEQEETRVRSRDLAEKLATATSSLLNLSTELSQDRTRYESSVSQASALASQVLESLELASKKLRAEVDNLPVHVKAQNDELANTLQQALAALVTSHARDLADTTTSLNARVSETESGLETMMDSTFVRIVNLRTLVEEYGLSVQTATKGMGSMSALSQTLSTELGQSVLLAKELQDSQITQSEAHLRRAHELSAVLANLTNDAQTLQRRRDDHNLVESRFWKCFDLLWTMISLMHWLRPASALVSQASHLMLVWRLIMPLLSAVSFVVSLATALPVTWMPNRQNRATREPISTCDWPNDLAQSSLTSKALASTSFKLTHPPTVVRAGLGSPHRPSRALPS